MWTTTRPKNRGYYWYRFTSRGHLSYGLALVCWQSGNDAYPPRLTIRSIINMDGENHDQGWALTSANWLDRETPEWWGPIDAPEGIPSLRKKPDWSPAPPKPPTTASSTPSNDVDERAERIKEAQEAGELLYECTSCSELIAEDDLVTVRECPHCNDETFNGTDEGNNCPQCNRPFTRKVTEHGCSDCLEECEVVPETETKTEEPAPEEPAPPTKRRRR